MDLDTPLYWSLGLDIYELQNSKEELRKFSWQSRLCPSCDRGPRTSVTDADLRDLIKLRNLKYLYLLQTGVTLDGLHEYAMNSKAVIEFEPAVPGHLDKAGMEAFIKDVEKRLQIIRELRPGLPEGGIRLHKSEINFFS